MNHTIPLPPHIEREKEPDFGSVFNEEGEFIGSIEEYIEACLTFSIPQHNGSFINQTLSPGTVITRERLNNTKTPQAIIEGVLPEGGVLYFTGSSKAGKTMYMMNVAASHVTNTPFLGRTYKPGNVYYIDGELSDNAFQTRLMHIEQARRIDVTKTHSIIHKSMMGSFAPLIYSARAFICDALRNNAIAVIIDPPYTMLDGSENDFEAVKRFCEAVSKFKAYGLSVYFPQHYPKGDMGERSIIDRGSGSGVFSRYADAIVDMFEIRNPDGTPFDPTSPDAKGFEVSYVCRHYPSPSPERIIQKYPTFELDKAGLTKDARMRLDPKSMDAKRNRERYLQIREETQDITRERMATKLGVECETIRRYEVKLMAEGKIKESLLTEYQQKAKK